MELQFDLTPHVYGQKFLSITDEENELIAKAITMLCANNPLSPVQASNSQFGWQSNFDLDEHESFQTICKYITETAYDFCNNLKGFNYKKIILKDLWANLNFPNDINWPHTHGSDISGVYYVDVQPNSGALFLESKALAYTDRELNKYLLDNFSSKMLLPENKKVIMFDSTLQHGVLKNLSQEVRMSLSFNLDVLL